jgi:uncharacterized protein with HEPN domain
MSLDPLEYLHHILTEVEYLLERSAGLSREDYHGDPTLQRAFLWSLTVIGEATKNLPEPLKKRNPQVPWSHAARMRDRLVHGYFGVDHDVVWEVVRDDVPPLGQMIQDIIAQEDSSA